MSLSDSIKAEARALGFERAGILPVGPARTHEFYEAWLEAGHAGEMGYLHRHSPLKRDPGSWMEGARSLICLAYPYGRTEYDAHSAQRAGFPAGAAPEADPAPGADLRGRISRYAWSRDYHDVLVEKQERLAAFIQSRIEQPLRFRSSVDAQPVMEREWAARAGLGWVGKNAMLINWELGSYLFLAELAVDIELDYDRPEQRRRRTGDAARRTRDAGAEITNLQLVPPLDLELRESCGSCRACVDACPTGAIVSDKNVDARRCISYLTIELKGHIPEPLRVPMGDWVFGCDICQEVCPWNRRGMPEYAIEEPAAGRPGLMELLALSEENFRSRFRRTPLWRTRRRGLARNAAIALGNAAHALAGSSRDQARHALATSLGDPEPVVRGASAWALSRFGPAARPRLELALTGERDPAVRAELESALARLSGQVSQSTSTTTEGSA